MDEYKTNLKLYKDEVFYLNSIKENYSNQRNFLWYQNLLQLLKSLQKIKFEIFKKDKIKKQVIENNTIEINKVKL
jgi:hypothetical protein